MTRPLSFLPLTDIAKLTVIDGTEVPAPAVCQEKVKSNEQCRRHYEALIPGRFMECPFGFTTKGFDVNGKKWAVSGVIAHPRFGSDREREVAKKFAVNRVTRNSVDSVVKLADELVTLKADALVEASKVLPQAFHELRKLNGTIIQHAERAISDTGETRGLLSIKGAAELMRNNFDILEALSNIEGMRSLPLDSTVNLYDLAFKMKRIYQERAASRSMSIHVSGVRAIVKGSQKSFPLIPAVLLENAIKYGEKGQRIDITVQATEQRAIMVVENESRHRIDPVRCFERGVRFANAVEGGGFGLFLAREVVASHFGSIRCEASGQAVQMIVNLPLSTVGRDFS